MTLEKLPTFLGFSLLHPNLLYNEAVMPLQPLKSSDLSKL